MSSDSKQNAVLEKLMRATRPWTVLGLGTLGVATGLGLGGFLLSDGDRVSDLRRRVIQTIEQTTASKLTALGALESWPSSAHAAAAAPYATAELLAQQTPKEAQIRDLRDQEISQLRVALGRRLPQNRKADLYLRLAELFLEAYRLEFILEGRVHEERLKKNVQDFKIDRGHSYSWLRQGLSACQDILTMGLAHPRIDQVYFFMGYAQSELGDARGAQRSYENLIARSPESPFVAEAYRELGEAAYRDREYRRSAGYFESSLKHRPEPSIKARVYHKLAWTQYRLRQTEAAIVSLKYAIASASQSGEKLISLREEALRDMAVFMTENGKVEEAISYFKNTAGSDEFYPRALEKLGKQYERNVQPEKAIQVYESLLKTKPEDEAAFRVFVKLVDLDLRRGQLTSAAQRLHKTAIEKKWLRGDGEHETQVAAKNLRAMVRRAATEQHELFRKSANRATLALAEDFYGLYLDLFLALDDSHNEAPEIKMYLAEVKREVGKPKEASKLYRGVIDSKDKRYAKEAGALWTASLADAIRKSPNAAGSEEPSELEKQFVEAADEMQESLGQLPEGREAALKAAQLLAGYPATRKSAIKRLNALIEAAPRSPQARTAAILWLQLLGDVLPKQASQIEKSSEADRLRDVIQTLRKNTALLEGDKAQGQSGIAAKISQLETRLQVGTIAQQEQENDFKSAAAGYERFAAQESRPDLAEAALTNAVNAHYRSGELPASLQVLRQWQKRFPKSGKPRQTAQSLATQAWIEGKFEESATVFLYLGTEAGDSDGLLTGASLLEGLGKTSDARKHRVDFLDRYSKSTLRAPLALEIAVSLAREGRDSDAARFFRFCAQVATGPLVTECFARLGDIYVKSADQEQAKAHYAKAVESGASGSAKSGEVSPYAAYAAWKLSQFVEREAKFSPLSSDSESLRKGLNERLEFLERLNRATSRAMERGGPWGVSALHQLATWVWTLTEEIERLTPPASVTGEAAVQFKKKLATELVEPLRKRALETWTSAYQKAVAAELLSPVLTEIGDRLSDARVAAPRRAQLFAPRFRVAGLPVDGGAEGVSKAFARVRKGLTDKPSDASLWIDYGNLLWGEGRPLLARMCYERAASLAPKNPAPANNRAALVLSQAGSAGVEDAATAAQAMGALRESLAIDDLFLPAKYNRASILSVYRLFAPAKPLWESLSVKAPSSDIWDGLAISQQGLGDRAGAVRSFAKATELGGATKRPQRLFHEAAALWDEAAIRAADCLDQVERVDESELKGFERAAVARLKERCTVKKN